MAIIKKFAPFQNLTNYQTFLVDSNPNSDYFRITEFKDTFTGGKNGFLIEGSEHLKETTEVKIEILDVAGNPIYFEPGEGIPEYYEGLSKLVAVHVYDDTPIGIAKITILGELKSYVDSQEVIRGIPEEWKGVYNVKWEKEFKVNKNLSNEDIVRFYKRPIIQIEELVKPIFSKSVQNVTDNVEVTGIPIIPLSETNLSNWRAGTVYRLIRATGSWDVDVDENIITVSLDDGSTYSPRIIEVLNDREVLVDVPYTINNIVSAFVSQSASITYQDFQNEVIGESALTGSFAKIDMFQLKTFVGDVARVKVFRKSRNEVGDFQFVQESRLESTELLRDITTPSNTEISYGRFSEDSLSNYWVIESNDHPVTVDSSVLSQALKFDYNDSLGGVQRLITSQSISISKDVEYELSFRTLLSGSSTQNKYLKAYLSGSYTNNLGNPASYIQSFMHISGSDIYKTRQSVSQNLIGERDINAKLVIEASGSDWYVSNVSLKNAQQTSFSPDEFTLIQDIPRKLSAETFDFRFEFYDINNNFIPVTVTATKEFTGGNAFPTSGKILTFESDRNAFRFSSGSVANPYNQTIQFKTTQQNLTGSILFTSQAFDVDGNYLEPTDYTLYPGLLTNVTTAGALLTLNNFTGSRVDGLPTPYVGSIVYTASLENLQEFETVYRLEDGDNAPSLLVTSNANQFIYEPTTLSPKPSGQNITIRAQRKNLASLVTPLTINKSDSNGPDLNYVDTVNGIDTYTLSATEFSASFAQNNFDEVTYSFTGSDVFGNQQSDEITISKVVNFDGVSIVLSTENTSFKADSTGTVTSAEFDKGDGTVDVRVGSTVISHSEGNSTKNTFDIISVTPSAALTANSTSPTTNSYGISAMNADSGTLTLLIRYKAGDNSTTIDFTKVVNYSKAKIAAPVLSIETTNKDQSVTAKSTGQQIDSFVNSVVTVREQYEGSSSTKTITNLTATSSDISSIVTTPGTGTITLSGRTLANGTNTTKVAVSATVTDSEGTSRTLTDTISLSKVKNSTPVIVASLNPQTQTVDANAAFTSIGTPQNITLIVNEGGSNYTYGTSGVTTFQITNVDGGTNNSNGTITPDTPSDETGTSGTITYSYINSEGTTFTGKTIDFSVGVSVQGVNGQPGLGAVSIELNPPSQEVVIDIQDNITTPDDFVVQVYDSLGNYTYNVNSAITGSFRVGSVTGGSNLNGTITPDSVPDANGLIVSVPIEYTDRDGNVSDEITKTHTIRVVADGSTGPGIVFTGEWDTDRIYQYDISNGRRDAVIYNGVYYATLQQAGTSVGTPDTEPTYWESLGTDSFFVAAEIGIFKQSYVQNTLNIGTTSKTLSSANITLHGADEYPYLSIGQGSTVGTQGYAVGAGIFLGRDDADGDYKFSLEDGDGTGGHLKWNGSTLDIKGSIEITAGPAADSISSLNSSVSSINQTTSSLNSSVSSINQTTSSLNSSINSINQTTASLNSSVNSLNSNSGSWVNPSEYSFGPDAAYDLAALPATPTNPGLYLGSTHLGYHNGASWTSYMEDNGDFFLGGSSGALVFDADTGNLSITGEISAGSGNIGGWIIGTDSLYKDGATDAASAGLRPSDYPFYAGKKYASRATAPFRVTTAGALTATSATITGAITAESGYIGTSAAGFAINSSYFKNGTKTSYNGAGTGVYIGTDGIGLGTAFTVSAAGALNATSATITGTITATDGYIGTAAAGFDINSSYFRKGTKTSYNGAGTGVYIGADGIGLGTAFTVSNTGVLNATSATIAGTITATDGTIGGFDINPNTIETTGLILGKTGQTYAINAGNGNFTVDHSGNLFAISGTFAGTVSGSLVQGGVLSGTTGDFSGTVTADNGVIGGWGISSGEIYSPSSGTKVMSLTAGSSPSISMLSSGNVVVDINAQTTLTDLGAGGAVSNTSSTTLYDTETGIATANQAFTINFLPAREDANYYDSITPQTITISPGDEGTYTVSATVSQTTGIGGRLAYASLTGGTTSVSSTFYGSVYMGWWITTNTLNPFNFIFDSEYSNQPFSVNMLNNGSTYSLCTNASAQVSKAVNFANPGTYYVYPVCWRLNGTLFLPYSAFPYQLNFGLHSPKITNLSASINIFKSELNAGGIQVVSSNTNYVKMERQPGVSSVNTVMLDVGGSIQATGNITANASDERLKTIKSKIENPLHKLKQLNGVIFNWNDIAAEIAGFDTTIDNVGLIAQEVQRVLPEIVTKSPIDNGNGKNYLTIWYDKLVPLLVESIKELSEKVEALEEENKKLKDGDS